MATKKSKPKPKAKSKVRSKPKTNSLVRPKTNAKKKVIAKISIKPGKLVGKVSHYFSNIEVGVIKLSAPLNQGDQIRIIGGENTDFNQKVASMQVDHQQVKKAKKGSSVGLKTNEKVREGYKVYKV